MPAAMRDVGIGFQPDQCRRHPRRAAEPDDDPIRLTCMLTRRETLTALAWLGVGGVGVPSLTACGTSASDSSAAGPLPSPELALSDVSRDPGSATARLAGVRSVQALTGDLYRRLAAEPGNLVCSPYSVAVALGMTLNGARGRTATEMDHVLHTSSPAALDSGLNSLTQLLESRAGRKRRADRSAGTVSLDDANSLWGQHGTRWEPEFLGTLARSYGAGMRLVDFELAGDRATTLINDWTAARTHGKIPEILQPGALDELTRLVLVNAIYFKAPWEEPFESTMTSRRPFHRAEGSRVDVDMMRTDLSLAAYSSGSGWRAARVSYLGGELAMAVVVPDQGRLQAVEASLDGQGLDRLLTSFRPVSALRLDLPRWAFRVSFELNAQLAALGMPTAFDPAHADFSAMTSEEQLFISQVVHQAFISVDEHGTEAAAATAVVMDTMSLPAPAVVLTVDRPFLFVIFDVETATPLFIGRVSDPTIA